MAAPAKFISFFFLITLLSMQVHGRESQFFSKVSNPNTQEKKVPENDVVPNEKQHQEQKESEFQLENQNTGYDTVSGELPTTAATANIPYKPDSKEFNSYPNTQNNNYYGNRYSFNGENQNEFDNSKLSQKGYDNQKAYFNGGKYTYNGEQQGMSDARFLENGRYFYDINSENNLYENTKNELPRNSNWKNNDGYYSQNNQNYNQYENTKSEFPTSSNLNNNGGYYSQNNQNYNQYDNTKSQFPTSSNLNNNGGYYSQNNQNYNQYDSTKNELPTRSSLNNKGGYYGQNNQNSYEYRNSMGGHQNEEPEQLQFEP